MRFPRLKRYLLFLKFAGLVNLLQIKKISRILELGNYWFATDFALISSIRGNIYTVLHSASEIAPADPGTEFDLGDTYCAKTLEVRGAKAYHCAGNSEISGHPCYNVFRLETYIGAPLFRGGHIVGTVNFTREEKREKFSDDEIVLVQTIAASITDFVAFP